MLRIIAGRFGGRRLRSAPVGRPTEGRVRAAIFNRLAGSVEGVRVLELYAGSGALGLEAVSRGARSCVFVERDRRALAVIKANTGELGVDQEVRCVKCDARRAGEVLGCAGEVFDLVLADPPYQGSAGLKADSGVAQVVAGLARGGCLAAGSLVVVEHRRLQSEPPVWPGFQVEAVRSYGDTAVTYLRYEPTRPGDEGEE